MHRYILSLLLCVCLFVANRTVAQTNQAKVRVRGVPVSYVKDNFVNWYKIMGATIPAANEDSVFAYGTFGGVKTAYVFRFRSAQGIVEVTCNQYEDETLEDLYDSKVYFEINKGMLNVLGPQIEKNYKEVQQKAQEAEAKIQNEETRKTTFAILQQRIDSSFRSNPKSTFITATVSPVGSKKQPIRPKLDLPSLQIVLQNLSLDASLFGLGLTLNQASTMFTYSREVALHLDTFCSLPAGYTGGKLIQANFARVAKFFLENGTIGSGLAAYRSSSKDLPIELFQRNDSAGVSLGPLMLDQTYNTLKLTAKQRASAIVKTKAVPALRALLKNFDEPGLQFYAVSVLFSSKSFLKDKEAAESEALFMCAPASLLRQFFEGQTTLDDVVDHSEIFMKEGGSESQLQRIRVVLD